MTILKDISVLWSLLHVLVMFALLFESRYPRKKCVRMTVITMVPLLLVNFFIYLVLGPEGALGVLLLTATVPSLIFFWILAKHRDGRFLFTFCLCDTLWLEVMYLTNIFDFYFGNSYVFMFVARLVVYPVIEWIFWKKLRGPYLKVQNNVKKGWYIFTAIGAIFYVATVLSMSVPTMIMERPEYLPAFLLLLLLMPVLYLHIFHTLHNQQKFYEVTEEENILRVQVSNMASRTAQFSAANEQFRLERHNFRHKMQVIAGLVDRENYEELRSLVEEYRDSMKDTVVKQYCSHLVMDAMLASYIQQAESKGIAVKTSLAFPEILPVPEPELATVMANALENAIHGAETVGNGQKNIDVKVLTEPRFMMQIRNDFDGTVVFDENGVPLSSREDHGFGTRSIVAFCNKYNGLYEFKTDDKTFSMRLVF